MTSVSSIQKATARHYKIRLKDLRGTSRCRVFAWPRQIAMHLSVRELSLSLPQVGRAFDRDHTTVMHADRAVVARMDERLRDDCDLIMMAVEDNAPPDAFKFGDHRTWREPQFTTSRQGKDAP